MAMVHGVGLGAINHGYGLGATSHSMGLGAMVHGMGLGEFSQSKVFLGAAFLAAVGAGFYFCKKGGLAGLGLSGAKSRRRRRSRRRR